MSILTPTLTLAETNALRPETLATILRVAVLVLVGVPLAFVLARLAERSSRARLTPQVQMIVRKIVFYTVLAIVGVMIVYDLGFNLTALLGAAGIAGLAIGFASQTSVANIISGLFLIGEKPFGVGDLIKVGETTGTVLSIDLLSVKLRTFDNQFVRIPNQTLMQSQLNNLTRFPIRRIDVPLSVAYKEDLAKVQRVLADVARENPHVLDEPEPLIMISGFGDSGIEIFFAVWAARADFFQVRRTLLPALKQRLDEEGVEIPFPHRTLYTGAVTEPMPIRLVSDDGGAAQHLPERSSGQGGRTDPGSA